MNKSKLESTARALVPKTKGILAADESLRSTKRRFDRLGIPHTAENRRAYRDMMFTTPGLEEFISGVILFDESIRQRAHDGTLFPKCLEKKGVIPGIKVDMGYQDLAGFPGEKVTQGLDGLRERLVEYRELGARFAKWRAVITIGDGIPSRNCLVSNAYGLARYAALCQEVGLVPIVEPDVLLLGEHSLERCEEVTSAMLIHTFFHLFEQHVYLEGMLLKPNMVLPGKDCPKHASVQKVAEATIRVFHRCVPIAVPGIVFLSGGQGAKPATERLNAISVLGPHPWEIAFSFLRALADPAFKVWKGEETNFDEAQKVFYQRAYLTATARQGKYSPEMESVAA